MTHPTEAHRQAERIRRSELLADLDRLNDGLEAHGVRPDLLPADLAEAPLSEIRSHIEQVRRHLKILNEQ